VFGTSFRPGRVALPKQNSSAVTENKFSVPKKGVGIAKRVPGTGSGRTTRTSRLNPHNRIGRDVPIHQE
jgi:hypothetical protein